MSKTASTTDKVIGAIAKAKRMPAEKITAETAFADLGVDSLDAIEILFELEEAFDLSVPDEAVRGMEKVSDVVEAVERALREQAAGGQD